MKKLFTLVLLFVSLLPLSAQEEKLKVAVFDPATSANSSIDDATRVTVRELISNTVVNLDRYMIVERSLLEKVMQEQQFANSGLVDDKDATEIGKIAGAHKIILSVVTQVGTRNMLSVKLIDTKTANIEQQKARVVAAEQLFDVVEPMTMELLTGNAVSSSSAPQPAVAQATATVEPSDSVKIWYQKGVDLWQRAKNKEAFSYTEKAAKAGYDKAQFQLAQMYAFGTGCKVDRVEACNWARKAAEQGLAEAAVWVIIYAGDMIADDERVALLKRAAEQQYAPAQFALGTYYEHGWYVECDQEEARKWYRAAIENPKDNSRKKRAEKRLEKLNK